MPASPKPSPSGPPSRTANGVRGGGALPYGELHDLMKMVSELGLAEVHVESRDLKIRIVSAQGRKGGVSGPAAPALVAAPAEAPAAAPAAPKVEEERHVVRSPMVGTFYRSPRPGAPPFVDVGARVEAGQVICIIEAMKLMNEIESDQAGIVDRILVDDGKPVEFGQALFALRPA